MKELALKYGCNPNQKPSRIFMEDGSELPIEVVNGRPGYINFLDAFNWSRSSRLPLVSQPQQVSSTFLQLAQQWDCH